MQQDRLFRVILIDLMAYQNNSKLPLPHHSWRALDKYRLNKEQVYYPSPTHALCELQE